MVLKTVCTTGTGGEGSESQDPTLRWYRLGFIGERSKRRLMKRHTEWMNLSFWNEVPDQGSKTRVFQSQKNHGHSKIRTPIRKG